MIKQVTCVMICLSLIQGAAFAQTIPIDRVLEVDQLPDLLSETSKAELSEEGSISQSTLAQYFRDRFASGFFYDWRTFDNRFDTYNSLYNKYSSHTDRGSDHMAKYADSTLWQLPFSYLNGEPVNAYALRHLARQHKMVDIAFMYFYNDKDPKYIDYFVRQMRSLNQALEQEAYEPMSTGNGVYEAFRSGYRILNWLTIHNMFLGQQAYTDEDQLTTIATLLQHGAELYEANPVFRPGNHQTRGMSALAMLAILFRDFEGTEMWYERAMTRLSEHLDEEINADGFQSERSVHYHISDIGNYFYVYQLAQINDIDVGTLWQDKLQSLFTTLTKIAYPDKSAPVLQDDTDNPWAEKNDIAGTLTLGYLLFEEPQFGFFAADEVDSWEYWFLQQRQLDMLQSIKRKKPSIGSVVFPETGYYIMREGWNKNDYMMIISAGLDAEKPDHQHGDMLGIQAMANGEILLPNYQVRYSLPDFDFFKNSMVKNVALVDDALQGKQWTGNKGGSGFGKFRKLPQPSVLFWESDSTLDLFVGSHDGFNDIGVNYTRQVIYVKDEFWIVKDNFNSTDQHAYKQVWQGHYTLENGPQLLRASFPNARGFDILQLNSTDKSTKNGTRGKEYTVVEKLEHNYSFITVLYPYTSYSKRLDETEENPKINDWVLNELPYQAEGDEMKSLTSGSDAFIFGTSKLTIGKTDFSFAAEADLQVKKYDDHIWFRSIGPANVLVVAKGTKQCKVNDESANGPIELRPGDVLKCELK